MSPHMVRSREDVLAFDLMRESWTCVDLSSGHGRLRRLLGLLMGAALVFSGNFSSAGEEAGPRNVALFKSAQEAFARKDFDGCQRLLETLLAADPENALVLFNLGNVELMLDRCEKALPRFEKLAASGGALGVPAQVNSAICLRQLGKFEESLSALDSIQGPGLSEGLRQSVGNELKITRDQLLIAGLNDREAGDNKRALARLERVRAQGLSSRPELDTVIAAIRRDLGLPPGLEESSGLQDRIAPYVLNLELAGGYNSNVNSTAIDSEANPLSPRDGAMASGGAYFGRKSGGELGFQLRPVLAARWEERVGRATDRFVDLRGELGLSAVRGSWSALLATAVRQEILDSRPYFLLPGARLRLTWNGQSQSFAWTTEAYQKHSQEAGTEYLEGSWLQSRLSWVRDFSNVQFESWVAYARESNQDLEIGSAVLPLAHRSLGLGAQIRGVVADNWQYALGSGWTWKYFNRISMPYSVRRIDLAMVFDARIEYFPVSSRRSYFISAAEAVNQSTLGPKTVLNKNFEQFKALVGISWELVL